MKTFAIVVVASLIGAVVAQRCTNDGDCGPCSPPGAPHCHSDGLCYCEIPTECEGPGDKKSCRNMPCRRAVCKRDGIHYHCMCRTGYKRRGG